jgi:FMN phosphatase YigB (HAD superfamily)
VLFVGDSPEHDIAGARPLGMHTALIVDAGVEPPGNRGDMAESLTRADHVIQSLDELIGIVDAGLSAGADAKS